MVKYKTYKPVSKEVYRKVNKEVFEELCRHQCTKTEILEIFGISAGTMNKWIKQAYGQLYGDQVTFDKVYKRFCTEGNASLRRIQWQMAEKSVPMAIFLGKQYLGQSDNPKVDNAEHEPVKVVISDCSTLDKQDDDEEE